MKGEGEDEDQFHIVELPFQKQLASSPATTTISIKIEN